MNKPEHMRDTHCQGLQGKPGMSPTGASSLDG
ncbi:uncharacterized protein METZ01_LOCUS204656, partial [marine metagenome]